MPLAWRSPAPLRRWPFIFNVCNDTDRETMRLMRDQRGYLTDAQKFKQTSASLANQVASLRKAAGAA